MRAYQAVALGHALDEVTNEFGSIDDLNLEFGTLVINNDEDGSKIICRWVPKQFDWDILTSEVEDDD